MRSCWCDVTRQGSRCKLGWGGFRCTLGSGRLFSMHLRISTHSRVGCGSRAPSLRAKVPSAIGDRRQNGRAGAALARIPHRPGMQSACLQTVPTRPSHSRPSPQSAAPPLPSCSLDLSLPSHAGPNNETCLRPRTCFMTELARQQLSRQQLARQQRCRAHVTNLAMIPCQVPRSHNSHCSRCCQGEGLDLFVAVKDTACTRLTLSCVHALNAAMTRDPSL